MASNRGDGEVRFSGLFAVVALTFFSALTPQLAAQDAREALGPRDTAAAKGPHPLLAIAAKAPPLRRELRGVHPRVYFTNAELDALRLRARSTHRDLWSKVLANVRALQAPPPPPPAEERRAQNNVAIAMAEAAFVYRIEGDRKYLDAALRYMDAAVSYDVWGYSYNKPNVDLAAGHLLYGLGWAYDLLYNDLTPEQRSRYRDKLIRQCRLMADYYALKPGRTFSYSQNHVFIPIAGFAVAAYALYDETPEAPQWAALARAIYDRVLATYSPDGYYYEGFEYYVFSTPWIIHYLDAQQHATGEDLWDQPGLRQLHLYAAHVELPGGKDPFDFGDVFEGPLTRAKKGEEYERTHPGGHLHSNYNLLYRLAARFHSAQAQGVADYLASLGNVNAEDFWSLAWYDAGLKAAPITSLPAWHYFPDHEVVFWRSSWRPDATAIAFKCGPPEGHHTARQIKAFADWHLSSGHAHPDANSFIFFANGRYISGDSGYAGVPMTIHHNSLLVDAKGQAAEGNGHDAWESFPYAQLDALRLRDIKASAASFSAIGEAAPAYDASLGLTSFRRELRLRGETLTISDTPRARTPRRFTLVLHSDDAIRAARANAWTIESYGNTTDVCLAAPRTAEPAVTRNTTEIESHIEPNGVTAPGPPGSVDKGERQLRGTRLLLTTAATTAADVHLILAGGTANGCAPRQGLR